MKRLVVLLPLALTLTGCATTQAPSKPPKPLFSCKVCQGVEYYGPQAPQKSESVQIMGILAGAVTSIAGYGFASKTVTDLTETAAGAGRVQVVEQPDPTVVRPEIVLVPGGTTVE